MNNQTVKGLIDDCRNEFTKIRALIQASPTVSDQRKFLTSYGLIKASGTLEQAYKTVLYDMFSGTSPQISLFLDKNLKERNKNATYENICSMIAEFDPLWKDNFKNAVAADANGNRFMRSMSSLNSNRNDFAHGRSFIASFNDINQYFEDSASLIEIMDQVIHH